MKHLIVLAMKSAVAVGLGAHRAAVLFPPAVVLLLRRAQRPPHLRFPGLGDDLL